MRVKILERYWNLIFVKKRKERDWYGKTERAKDSHKTIYIEKGQSDEMELDTILHECLHAGFWCIDERHVAIWARDVAKILTDRGYKKDPT